MKKIICSIFAVIALLIITTIIFAQGNSAVTESRYPVFYNNNQIESNLSNLSINDITYIPLREFCNIFKINIEWDKKESIIRLSDKREVNMLVDEIVKNEETAIEIAKIAVKSIYGSVNNDLSFIGNLDSINELWTVTGILPENYDGGVPIVIIQKSDGRIVSIEHGK